MQGERAVEVHSGWPCKVDVRAVAQQVISDLVAASMVGQCPPPLIPSLLLSLSRSEVLNKYMSYLKKWLVLVVALHPLI